MRAWIYKPTGKVKRDGQEATPYYLGWRDFRGRRRAKRCGLGDAGYSAAQALKTLLESHAGMGLDLDPGARQQALAALDDEIVKASANKSVVYFVEAVGLERLKIGRSDDFPTRLINIRCCCPVPLKVLALIQAGPKVEKDFHYQFGAFRLHGEWFQITQKMRQAVIDLKRVSAGSPGDRLGLP